MTSEKKHCRGKTDDSLDALVVSVFACTDAFPHTSGNKAIFGISETLLRANRCLGLSPQKQHGVTSLPLSRAVSTQQHGVISLPLPRAVSTQQHGVTSLPLPRAVSAQQHGVTSLPFCSGSPWFIFCDVMGLGHYITLWDLVILWRYGTRPICDVMGLCYYVTPWHTVILWCHGTWSFCNVTGRYQMLLV